MLMIITMLLVVLTIQVSISIIRLMSTKVLILDPATLIGVMIVCACSMIIMIMRIATTAADAAHWFIIAQVCICRLQIFILVLFLLQFLLQNRQTSLG